MTEVETHLAESRQALAAEDLHGTLAWIELYLHGLEAQPAEIARAVLNLYASVLEAWVDAPTAQLARAAALDTDDPVALHRLGRELLDKHELEPSRGVLSRASRFAPERPDLWHARAAAEARLGQHAQAATLLEQAPEAVRTLPLTRYLHAIARFSHKDPEPARSLLRAPLPALAPFVARLEAMLARHAALAPASIVSPEAEARAWHAIWTAQVVIDPLGKGRATLATVRSSLAAVAEAVAAWHLPLVAVTAPADRDSELLARALAEGVAIPFQPIDALPGGPTLVAIWDARPLSPSALARVDAISPRLTYLHQRVTADIPLHVDIVGRLTATRPPWGHAAEVFALVGEPPPAHDPRPLAVIASELAASPSDPKAPDGWQQLLVALAALPHSARPQALVAMTSGQGSAKP